MPRARDPDGLRRTVSRVRCYGCFGPSQPPNTEAFAKLLLDLGMSPREVADKFRFITGYAPEFRAAAERLEEAST